MAFIISRKGVHSNATKATLGCLKESRKLINGLNDDDLIKMIYMKENGEEVVDDTIKKVSQNFFAENEEVIKKSVLSNSLKYLLKLGMV